MGIAIAIANNKRYRYSWDNRIVIFAVLAPCTFRIPISFVRKTVEYDTKANRPMQAKKIARMEKAMNTLPNLTSDRYWALKSEFKKK